MPGEREGGEWGRSEEQVRELQKTDECVKGRKQLIGENEGDADKDTDRRDTDTAVFLEATR